LLGALLGALLGNVLGTFAVLGSMTKVSTSTAFCGQQDWTQNIASTIANIVGIKPIIGSIEADFAEH